jgi:hypothetical protein
LKHSENSFIPPKSSFVFRLDAFPRDLVATCRREKLPISDGNHGGKFNRRGVVSNLSGNLQTGFWKTLREGCKDQDLTAFSYNRQP